MALLDAGVLQQCASPSELFATPLNVFVAGFIGSPAMNLLPATLSGSAAMHGSLRVPVTPAQAAAASSDQLTILVRPESWHVEPGGSSGLQVDIAAVEELGSELFLSCREPDQPIGSRPIVARDEGLSSNSIRDRVTLMPRPESAHLFDAATGLRLGGPRPGTPAQQRSPPGRSTD